MFPEYDIIVVGAGHAGCEAAAAAANLGSRVLLVTMDMAAIARMSCNPAMGGVAKGQIVREIDALGGYSGIVSDRSAIQFRMLNRSKGPAMWSPRTQNDRAMFSSLWREMLEQTGNRLNTQYSIPNTARPIDFWQDMVAGLLMNNDKSRVIGIKTGMGMEIMSRAVVLTNGTFLNGIIHIGQKQFGGGRMAEKASTGITEQLISLGFLSGRMKTGTPPRVDGRSIDYSKMEEQKGDEKPSKFSFLDNTSPFVPRETGSRHETTTEAAQYSIQNTQSPQQLSCHITYTSPEVHEVLKTGFEDSPMFTGRIQGQGPRYCPSIEDKINRFADKTRHQIFVEPEGWNTVEIYVNGFSTSLAEDVQYKALTLIPGFENVRMFRPGYAIEYDYFPPHQLKLSLETQKVKNLFFAGQINGTTGYEEAAGQGIMAGINAHRAIIEEDALVLKRDEAYIGVLIDDLVTKGTDEPYRMFTSRAEYRIMLRQDNADSRLTPLAHKIGLASDQRMERLNKKLESIASIRKHISGMSVEPEEINGLLDALNTNALERKTKLISLLLRPQVFLSDLTGYIPTLKEYFSRFNGDSIEEAEIEMKYEGYIQKEKEIADKLGKLEDVPLPTLFDYSLLNALSLEAREKLAKVKPSTIGQASRIPGVNPSDVAVLMVHLGR